MVPAAQVEVLGRVTTGAGQLLQLLQLLRGRVHVAGRWQWRRLWPEAESRLRQRLQQT
jgi:hypothetical protein